jgi:hypothetical protein
MRNKFKILLAKVKQAGWNFLGQKQTIKSKRRDNLARTSQIKGENFRLLFGLNREMLIEMCLASFRMSFYNVTAL